MAEEEKQQYKFDVFISYRHADLDSAVAGYLQKSLEHYKIPKEIQQKCGKERLNRVFRDEEELGVASDLFNEIEQNLKQSEFLLVICSPRVVESKWCRREIETFIKYHGRESILAVLIEGEPEESFPPILLEEGEPLAADLRGKNKREVLKHAKERMPRLVAPLLYCSYDDLYQRHRIYKMRRAVALTGLVAAVSLAFGVVTVKQNLEITKNYTAKLENQSRYLAETSTTLLEQGDREAALLVALEALPGGSGDDSRPYVAEARVALENALNTYRLDYLYTIRPQKVLKHSGPIAGCTDFDEAENVLLTCDTMGNLYIWDGETGENISTYHGDQTCMYARLAGDRRVLIQTPTGFFCYDYTTLETLWQWELPACESAYCSAPGNLLWDYSPETGEIYCVQPTLAVEWSADYTYVTVNEAHQLHTIDAATGESRCLVPMGYYTGRSANDAAASAVQLTASPDGTRLLLATKHRTEAGTALQLDVLDAESAETLQSWTFPNAGHLSYLGWLDEGRVVTVEAPERAELMSYMGKDCRWKLTTWDVASGEALYTYEDASKSLENAVSVQPIAFQSGDGSMLELISVIYDNVLVTLDQETGARYTRVEDRSPIRLSQPLGEVVQLNITADGYVFTNYAHEDFVWPVDLTAYHYYLDLNNILKAEYHNEKTYLFTDTDVYCYGPQTDDSYTLMDAQASQVGFLPDGSGLFTVNFDGTVTYFRSEDRELVWKDTCHQDPYGSTAAFTDSHLAYLKEDGQTLMFYDLQSGGTTPLVVEDFPPDYYGNPGVYLRRAGSSGDQVLVWSEALYFPQQEGSGAAPLVWLAEPDGILRTWTLDDLLAQVPDAELVSDLMLLHPAITGDGSRLVVPVELTWFDEQTGESTAARRILLFDTETGGAVPVAEEAQQGLVSTIAYGSFYSREGWTAPTGSHFLTYDWDSGTIRILDGADGTVLHTLETDTVGSCSISFTPDGDHIVFQDGSLRLKVYNWREGEYTMAGTLPEAGCMEFSFHQDGQVLSAQVTVDAFLSNITVLYQKQEEGVYREETSISACGGCDGTTVVITDSSFPRLYAACTLDELIARARDILDGQELTEMERKAYLID